MRLIIVPVADRPGCRVTLDTAFELAALANREAHIERVCVRAGELSREIERACRDVASELFVIKRS